MPEISGITLTGRVDADADAIGALFILADIRRVLGCGAWNFYGSGSLRVKHSAHSTLDAWMFEVKQVCLRSSNVKFNFKLTCIHTKHILAECVFFTANVMD